MKLFQAIDELIVGIGRFVVNGATHTVMFVKFCLTTFRYMHTFPRNFRMCVEQMNVVGTESIILVCITSVFTGAVGAFTFVTQFGDYIPVRYVGAAVGSTVMVAVGPVLTGLVITGRVGAAITAEIGTMTVTEQVDAMKCLNLNPFKYLFVPKIIASIVMMPVLSVFSIFVALMGALAILKFVAGVSSNVFFSGVRMFYTDWGLAVGLFKPFIFGLIISLVGCFLGYYSKNGAEGVGKATRASVVVSDIAILISAWAVDSVLL